MLSGSLASQVQLLSAVVSSVANSVGAQTIFDVGAGQVQYNLQLLCYSNHTAVIVGRFLTTYMVDVMCVLLKLAIY